MSSGDKVVIAVDDSKYAENAFDWYFKHVHRTGNVLFLVYCLEFTSVPNREYWEVQTREGRSKGHNVQEKFNTKCESHRVKAKFHMDFDKPGEFICRVAKEEAANMIVMGTRGMGTIRRTILGSVSDYVLHHANCPVMVVRQPKDES